METTIMVQNLFKSFGNIPAIPRYKIFPSVKRDFGLLGANGAKKVPLLNVS